MPGKNKKIEVVCDFAVSEKCKGKWIIPTKLAKRTRVANDGRIICLYCSRKLKYSGRCNPNCKYKSLPDAFFEDINTEGKSYLLGWIASDGSISDGAVSVVIHVKDVGALEVLRDIICPELPVIYLEEKNQVRLSFSSKQIVQDICKWLKIKPGSKWQSVRLPQLPSENLMWSFLRGYFDGDGSVNIAGKSRRPTCSIASGSDGLLLDIQDFYGGNIHSGKICWGGASALDFLGKIYDGSKYRLVRKWEKYLDWSGWLPSLAGKGNHGKDAFFKWSKVEKLAVKPYKERASDSGFDLTLLSLVGVNGKLETYTTGVKVQPIYGWYFDLVARSSLYKYGRMLANSIGVIDQTYCGPIMVNLLKFDAAADKLSLPGRYVQIIPRPIIHFDFVEEDFTATRRNTAGFGSTGVK
jgi:dUTPase